MPIEIDVFGNIIEKPDLKKALRPVAEKPVIKPKKEVKAVEVPVEPTVEEEPVAKPKKTTRKKKTAE